MGGKLGHHNDGPRTTTTIRLDGCTVADAYLKRTRVEASSKCLECPFPVACIEDKSSLQRMSSYKRNSQVVRNLARLSSEEVAVVTGLSVRTVQRHRRDLEEERTNGGT